MRQRKTVKLIHVNFNGKTSQKKNVANKWASNWLISPWKSTNCIFYSNSCWSNLIVLIRFIPLLWVNVGPFLFVFVFVRNLSCFPTMNHFKTCKSFQPCASFTKVFVEFLPGCFQVRIFIVPLNWFSLIVVTPGVFAPSGTCWRKSTANIAIFPYGSNIHPKKSHDVCRMPAL